MRILKIILHSIFLLLGISFLFEPGLSQELNNLLGYSLFAYVAIALVLSVLKEVVLFAFPRHFGMLAVFTYLSYFFFTGKSELIGQDQLFLQLTMLSVIFAVYFLISSLIGIRFSFKFRKIKTSSFRKQYWFNYLIFTMLIGASVFFTYALLKGSPNQIFYSLVVLFALYPHLNRNQIRTFSISLNTLSEKLDLNISFNQIGKLAKIKNLQPYKLYFIQICIQKTTWLEK